MPKYGLNTVYGTDFYGDGTLTTITSDVEAVPLTYGSIQVSWTTPGGTTWTRLRLVRSSFGVSETVFDGTTLLDVDNCGPETPADQRVAVPTSFVDTDLAAPQWYYYSVWALKIVGITRTWVRAGSAQAMGVSDHGYSDYLLRRIPGAYVNADREVAGQPQDRTTTNRFVGVLAFDLSRFRDLADHLLYIRDASKVSGALLPYVADTLGQQYEPELGMRQNRVLLDNASFLTQLKGTNQGVVSFASALTGCSATRERLVNLMINGDQASADYGISTWITENSSDTLTRQAGTPSFDSGVAASFKLTRGSSGSAHLIAHSCAPSQVKGWGVPVRGGLQYAASAYVRANTASTAVTLTLTFYDVDGNLVSAVTGSASTATTTDWSGRPSAIAAAPQTATYATVTLDFGPQSAGTIVWFDAVQVERTLNLLSAYDSSFEPTPGPLSAALSASSALSASPTQNTTGHPTGAALVATSTLTANTGSVGSWTVGSSWTAETSSANPMFQGTQSLLITRTDTAPNGYLKSAPLPLPKSNPLVFSVYISPSAATPYTLTITSIDPYGRVVQTASENFTPPANTYSRMVLRTVTPATTQTVSVSISDAGNPSPTVGATAYIDSIQLECAHNASPFAVARVTKYDHCRTIRLAMTANRVNEIANAGFDVDVTQWTTSSTSGTAPVLSQDLVTTYDGGSASCEVDGTNSVGPAVSTTCTLDQQRPLVSAVEVYPSVTGSFTLTLAMQDSVGTTLQTATTTETLTAGEWTQVQLTGITTPAGTAAGVWTLTGPDNSIFHIDDVQVEHALVVGDYFDPSKYPGDVLYEGAVAESRSHLYLNYLAKSQRLLARLPDVVPLSAAFDVVWAPTRATSDQPALA